MANKLSKLEQHMKGLTITSIILFFALLSKAQVQESDKVYWTALERYTKYLDTAYLQKSTALVEKRAIYLKKQDFIDSIPEKVNGYPIILLTSENYKRLYKEHKGSLTHTIMFPVKVSDSTLEVTIVPYSGNLKRNHLNLGVSGGTTITFQFDCVQHKFVVSKVNSWGI
jgi:hypothetical protein